ncbi:uncharacterized protein OCT59_026890 [Rhizophagus irregularis]|uniref:Uncharacterized protein n=1 Tax=Rhizophagus irregularis (strain DAOM 181602 / DAOM 197198 / MUCL 43194) TaxID=747089 RepID=U9T692_RHIID|nr:hypothetical protein OCT59_026890 [Rhizophagus irregularis]GBC22680.1 hypothetical protein RIR_jg13482.t1 [Rhizophagus irregularis DAOM 181602=DAOM 197198]
MMLRIMEPSPKCLEDVECAQETDLLYNLIKSVSYLEFKKKIRFEIKTLPSGQHSSRALHSALESSVSKTFGPTCGSRSKKACYGRIILSRFNVFSNVISDSSEVINKPRGRAPTVQLV